MSKHPWRSRLLICLPLVLAIAGFGCRTCGKVPCYQTDASIPGACHGKTPADHTIAVDDSGGVGASDICVAIKRDHSGPGNWVHWVPKGTGHQVSIIFILGPNQKTEPFQNMACGGPDPKGNRLCSLLDCPGPCKTVFNANYQPSTTDPDLNYYYYSPVASGVLKKKGGEAKSGSDPGIRIDP